MTGTVQSLIHPLAFGCREYQNKYQKHQIDIKQMETLQVGWVLNSGLHTEKLLQFLEGAGFKEHPV